MKLLWILATLFTWEGTASAQRSCADYTNRPSVCERLYRCHFSEGYCQDGRKSGNICGNAKDIRQCNTRFDYKDDCFWDRNQNRCKPKVEKCERLSRTNRQICEGYDPKLHCEWDPRYSSCKDERDRRRNDECPLGQIRSARVCIPDRSIPEPDSVICARFTEARFCDSRAACSWKGNACGTKRAPQVCGPNEYLQSNGTCLKPDRICRSFTDLRNCLSNERKNYCTWLNDDGREPNLAVNTKRDNSGKCRAQQRFGGSRW